MSKTNLIWILVLLIPLASALEVGYTNDPRIVFEDTIVDNNSFLNLSDTPSNYSGFAGKVAAVNAGEDALEFVPMSGGGIAYSPWTNDTINVFLNSDAPLNISTPLSNYTVLKVFATDWTNVTVNITQLTLEGVKGDIIYNDGNSYTRFPRPTGVGTYKLENTDAGNLAWSLASVVVNQIFKTWNPDLGSNIVADTSTDTATVTSTDQSILITGDSNTDTLNFTLNTTLPQDDYIFENITVTTLKGDLMSMLAQSGTSCDSMCNALDGNPISYDWTCIGYVTTAASLNANCGSTTGNRNCVCRSS